MGKRPGYAMFIVKQPRDDVPAPSIRNLVLGSDQRSRHEKMMYQ